MDRFNLRRRGSAWHALAVVVAATLPAAGCMTMKPVTTTTTTTGTNPTPGGPDTGGPRTEFHREIGPEQEYNVHVELARFHESQGDNEAAVVEYQKAVEVCEKKGTALLPSKLGPVQQSLAQRRLATSLDRLGRFAQAQPHYLKALQLTPNDTKVWNDAGYSYYLQNRFVDAERTFKTADALEPNNPRILTNLGLTLAAAGKNDEALAALTRAGGPAVGHANLGYVVAAMGKTDLARQHYQQAILLQPELAPARQALAKLDAAAAANPVTAVASTTVLPLPRSIANPAPVAAKPATTVSRTPPAVKDTQAARAARAVKDAQVARAAGTLKTTPPAPETAPKRSARGFSWGGEGSAGQ